MNIINRPEKSEYPSFYSTYIDLITSEEILKTLELQRSLFASFVQNFPGDKANYRYAEGKWTVKEVIGHVIDTERIMAYRALAFSRGEQQSLPGFSENEYAANANANERILADMAEEFDLLRASNIKMLENFDPGMFMKEGVANEKTITVRALVYIIAGHLEHHIRILKERYLIELLKC